jgi:ribosome biogenesis GTPase
LSTLASLGYDEFFARQFAALGEPTWVPARIAAEGQSSFHLAGCRAALGDLTGKRLQAQGKLERPVVGDWVVVTEGPERAQIQRRLERRTALLRRAAGTLAEPQVVAVNVDVFFVVMALNRDFNERRLERYVAAVWSSGAAPVVVLNKVDLVRDTAPYLEAVQRAAIDVPIVQASAATGAGLEALRAHVGPGKTIGFIGSSGVGKSSLTNRLLGKSVQLVGELRSDERGRHTTSSRQLLELPDGGVLIDTPGLRELGLLEDVGGLDASFADVLAFGEHCKFRDCAHTGEPGCAAAAAVDAGALSHERLASYRKLHAETGAATPSSRGAPRRGRSK